MKMKLILLCTFLMLYSSLARGQDTLSLLEAYAQGEFSTIEVIENELSTQEELNIDRYGVYSCPFSQAVENTLVKVALNNPGKIHLNFEYYDLSFASPALEEEYYLQRVFQQHYPKRFLDFLKIKMQDEEPVSLNKLKNHHGYLFFDDLEAHYNATKLLAPELTTKRGVGLGKSSIFINDISLFHTRFPEMKNDRSCECNEFDCWTQCMTMDAGIIQSIIFGICGYACGVTAGPGGATVIPGVVCVACVHTFFWPALFCAANCNADPCHSYTCEPGTIPENPQYICNGPNSRKVLTCNCEGDGYEWQVTDPCPDGLQCSNNICVPCPPLLSNPSPRTSEQGREPEPLDGALEKDDSRRACNLNSTISINQESAPNANDGSIAFSLSGGNSPYSYYWENGSNSSTITNLSAGTYCVTVTDSRCCYLTKCISIVTLACDGVNINFDFDAIPSCNGDDGILTVQNITGGWGPYTYEWSNGQTGASIEDLEVDYYYVTVTDSNGCYKHGGILLTGQDDTTPVELIGEVTHTCPGDPNMGAIDFFVVSSFIIDEYNWSNGANTQSIDGLSPGTYTVTVTDECSFENIASFEVGVSGISSTSSPSIQSTCEGIIELTITQGASPYALTINGPNGASNTSITENNHTFTDLCPGDYTITSTDANGCILILNETVLECPATIYEDWYFDITSQQFCREFSVTGSAACQAQSGQYCFTPILGEWIYNESFDEYCRTVDCPSGAYCDDFNIIEQCFVPIFTNWQQQGETFCADVTCTGPFYCDNLAFQDCFEWTEGNCGFNNQEMCDCEAIVNGMIVGSVESDPVISWGEYDEDSEECLQIFTCSSGQTFEDYVDPVSISDWTFEPDDQSCMRIVICTEDIEIQEIQDDPGIEWFFDSGDQECIAFISCEYSIFDDLEEPGTTTIDWDFDQGGTWDCVQTVECSFDGEAEETFTIWEEPEQEFSGVEEDDGWYYCILTYICGDGAYEEEEDIPSEVASCENNGDGTCTYSCDSYSMTGPCNLNQCPEGEGRSIDRSNYTQIDKFISNNLVVVLPNPFRSEIQLNNLPVDRGNLSIKISDSNGINIKTIHINQKESLTIDTSTFAEGVYFIKVFNEDQSFMQIERVVKVN